MRMALLLSAATVCVSCTPKPDGPIVGATYLCAPDGPGRAILATVRAKQPFGSSREVVFVSVVDTPKAHWQPRIAFAPFDAQVFLKSCGQRTDRPLSAAEPEFEAALASWRRGGYGVIVTPPTDEIGAFRRLPGPPLSGDPSKEPVVSLLGPPLVPASDAVPMSSRPAP